MIPPSMIDAWRLAPSEHAHLEFKEAKSTFDFDRLCQYCVAIANEGGGHLVLGIADSPPRRVVGSAALSHPATTVERIHAKLGFHIEVSEVHHPDGRVVVVGVPSRPRGTAYALDGRYLMRSGGSLVAMTEDRLRTIFDEGKPDWPDEVSRRGMTAQEVIETLDTQTFFELRREPFPTSTGAIIDRLTREGVLVTQDDRHSLLRLGGMLLARNLDDFPDLRRRRPRAVVYRGNSKIETTLDHIFHKGYAVGFRDLVQFIMSHLPQNEVIQSALRKEAKLLPELAIRELVANALVHQDFLMSGASVMIEIYANRIEISNPGTPIVELNRFIDGYQSRNERLADMMRRMGICEEKGSGIDKVVSAAEAAQLPAPQFRQDPGRTTVVLAGPKPFEQMDREERIRACYQHAGLKRVTNDFMTNQSLRERFSLPSDKSAIASQVIAATVEAGLVKADESVGTSLKLRRYLPYWA
ncbi:MAG: MloB [Phycisphaera sp.]|nr:MloB [Phycisphaera sp.]